MRDKLEKDIGFFERTSDMVFALERRTIGKKVKQIPVIWANQPYQYADDKHYIKAAEIWYFTVCGIEQ